MLVLLCRAHLAVDDAAGACRALDALACEVPGALLEPGLQLLCVEVRVRAGRVPEALTYLLELLNGQADLAHPTGQQAAATFLAGLRLALGSAPEGAAQAASLQTTISAFVRKATAADPALLLGLVEVLLAQDQVGPGTRQAGQGRRAQLHDLDDERTVPNAPFVAAGRRPGPAIAV